MPEREGEPIRVVVAEDHYLVREGVRALLEEADDVEVLDAVGTAVELKQRVDELEPDAILTDVRMPPSHSMEGIEAAHEIRGRHPGIGVVVLSQHADPTYAHALLGEGSEGLGYLLKDRIGDLEELVRALREVTRGGSVMDPRVLDALVERRAQRASSGLDELTPRELDVLKEMARGRSNPAIAAELVLSESAVEKHITSIFSKLGRASEGGSHRRVEAVLMFLQEQV